MAGLRQYAPTWLTQLPGVGEAAWPDGTVSGRYGFRHALYQEVLYQRLGSGRRMRCHRAIGTRLEAGYGVQAARIAAALAGHFERGHDAERAVRYRQQAAAQALERYAYPEAVSHLTQGLALLARLPEPPARAQQELDLQLALGSALIPTKGSAAPEVEQTYTRAGALCEQIGETPSASRRCGAYGVFISTGGYCPRRGNWRSSSTGWPSARPTRRTAWRRTMPAGSPCSTWATTPPPRRTARRGWPSLTPWRRGPGAPPWRRACGGVPRYCGPYAVVSGVSRAGRAAESGGAGPGAGAGPSL